MHISVVGAGTWGTALAHLACRCGHRVRLWAREPEVVEGVANTRLNPLFLADVELPVDLLVTGDFAEAIQDADVVIIAVPSQHLRRVLEGFAPHVPPDAFFVSATKGLEEKTCLRMSEVITQVFAPRMRTRVVAISGPTFAREVIQEQPTALVAAGNEPELTQLIQSELSTMRFRIYTNDDIIGVELGGAVKNVIAIAAGVASGLGIGHNSLAALVTRGLSEMSRLCEAMGGKRKTLSGLAGMGDLLLTCTGRESRNRQVGFELGRGNPLGKILSSMRMIAEGVPTTRSTIALAQKYHVEMPITDQMGRLLRGETTPAEAIRDLMSRPLKQE